MPSANAEKLHRIWGHLESLGASDQELHQLVMLAQDIEINRVAFLLETVIAMGAKRLPPEVIGILRVLKDELESKTHRPRE